MKYPLFKVHIDTDAAMENIRDVLEGGLINEGDQVTQFTSAMKERMGTKQLIATNSCTSALTLAMHLADVSFLDEVITTSMTCVATNCPIVTRNARIVWADINHKTGCIDVKDVERLLEDNPATKAVVAVAWAGNPPELAQLGTLCQAYGTKLILDAAHALGSTYRGTAIHEWADYTCYSLQAIKHITTGDGGILVCHNEDDWLCSKQLKWFGIDRDAAKDSDGNWKGQHGRFDISEAGYKFNMNNMAAAIGLSQLPHIDMVIDSHRRNAAFYDRSFAGSEHIMPLQLVDDGISSHWVYTVLVDSPKIRRDELVERLNAEGIGAGLVHVPNHHYTCFSDFNRPLPGVEKFDEIQFSLPVGWWLNEDDIEFIASRVRTVCQELSTARSI